MSLVSQIGRRSKISAWGFVALAMFATLALATHRVCAQSGSRSPTPRRPAPRQTAEQTRVGLEGYCPVCIIEMKKWVRGNPRLSVSYDGMKYFFPGEKQRKMFVADPAKYVPALGGDCTVCWAKMNRRVPGNIRHAAFFDRRLFLFPGEDQKSGFLASPVSFADVDLAFNGNCAVCKTEMNKDVPGKPEVTAIYRGMRYQFPSPRERDMFLANPAKYAAGEKKETAAVSLKAPSRRVTIRGQSSCAGCEHGVAPIAAPDTLGLAVTSRDGGVFVVENAHQRYPSVYERRFDGLEIEVTGRVIRRDGMVAWIQPTELRVLN